MKTLDNDLNIYLIFSQFEPCGVQCRQHHMCALCLQPPATRLPQCGQAGEHCAGVLPPGPESALAPQHCLRGHMPFG